MLIKFWKPLLKAKSKDVAKIFDKLNQGLVTA
jgi:hypothetical protein